MRHFLLTLLFCSGYLIAQEKSTISGYLKDAETGEAMIGAKVYVPELGLGVIANTFGFYSLTLENGEYEVIFSFVGKEPEKKLITLDQDIELDIQFKPKGTLDVVTVVGQKQEHETTEMGTIELSMDKVKTLPVLLGERDIIKTAQLLPGIQSGSEGSSGLYVRGGGPDQNLILLDGVPIYNANHLFGFFSVFNADAINSVKLVKGGFPAEYGGRISSVIDIHMNEGDMKQIHGEGSVGIISSKLMLNGPIIKDKTSFMISARRTYIDLLAKPFINLANKNAEGDEVTGGYFFYDVNAKVNHIFSSKDRLYFSAYLGNDKFYINNRYEYNDFSTGEGRVDESTGGMKWGNKIMALRWNHKFSPKLFANTTVNFSEYKFNTGFSGRDYLASDPSNTAEDFSFDYDSGILDWGGNISFYYYPNPKHKIQFGVGNTYHTFTPGVNQIQVNDPTGGNTNLTYGSDKTFAHEFFGYVQDDFIIGKRFMMNAGVHFSNFVVRDKYYGALQPRASINYKLDEKSSLKASYARTAQFLHLLTNTSIGLPTDLWVPATDSIAPQFAHQVALGYSRDLNNGYYVSTEAYYKDMRNLIEYKEGASFFSNTGNWESLVETGRGWSYGLEVLLEKRTGKTTGWIGYTLGWTNRQFENLNQGEIFPYRYDRRHDISVVVTHKLSDKWDFGEVWVYGTGNAVTLAFQEYGAIQDGGFGSATIQHIESRNNYRMPSYHRLDIGANLHKEKKWGTATWSFGVYNTYNRQNPFYLEYGLLKGGNEPVLKQISLFPILPSVSYSFKF